jgi:hypothetical protein
VGTCKGHLQNAEQTNHQNRTKKSLNDFGHPQFCKEFQNIVYRAPSIREASIVKRTRIQRKTTPITYYWTLALILPHSYLIGNLTSSKIAETKALEPLKS